MSWTVGVEPSMDHRGDPELRVDEIEVGVGWFLPPPHLRHKRRVFEERLLLLRAPIGGGQGWGFGFAGAGGFLQERGLWGLELEDWKEGFSLKSTWEW